MKKQWMLAPVIAAAAVLGSWVLLHGNDSQAQSPVGGAPPEVTVAQALSRKVSDSANFTGRLEPVNSVQVQPRVGGFV
jgi:multidrug efflux system membrane fusion protein